MQSLDSCTSHHLRNPIAIAASRGYNSAVQGRILPHQSLDVGLSKRLGSETLNYLTTTHHHHLCTAISYVYNQLHRGLVLILSLGELA